MASTEKELGVLTQLVICVVLINSICHVDGAKKLFVNTRPDSSRFITIQSQSPTPLSVDSIVKVESPGEVVRESPVLYENGGRKATDLGRRSAREATSLQPAQAPVVGDPVIMLPANSTSTVSFNLSSGN